MAQIQCPNCGGFKTNYTSAHLDRQTGKSTRSPEHEGCAVTVIGLAMLGTGIAILSGVSDPLMSIWIKIIVSVVGLAFAVFGGMTLYAVSVGASNRISKGEVREIRQYSCQICGKEWTA